MSERVLCLVLMLAGALLLGDAQVGEAQQLGEVEGRVIDASTNRALPHAEVVLEATSFRTTADAEGRFRLRNVRPGTYRLDVRYLGYTHQAVAVVVEPGQVLSRDLALQPLPVALSEVVVAGIRSGQARALSEQLAAPSIKNVVDQEQMELFPDMNPAEVLSRVPGVNIGRSRGEGKYVYLRGTEPRFTNVTVNGQVLGTTRPETRTHALDIVSADQLAAIEVTKAITPDLDASATGGSVNLITRGPYDRPETSRASLKLGSGYSALGELPLYQGAFSYLARFGEEQKVGMTVNATYDRLNRNSHQNEMGQWRPARDVNGTDMPHALEELMLLNYGNVRDRYGLSSTLEFRPSERSRYYVHGTFNQRTDDQDRQRSRTRFDAGDYLDATTVNRIRLEYEHHDREVREKMHAITAGAANTLGAFDVDYRVGYSYSLEDKPNGQLISTFRHNARPNVAINMTDPAFPTYSVTNFENWSEMFSDLDRWELQGMDWRTESSADRNIVGQFNLQRETAMAGGPLVVRFGTQAHLKRKDRDDERTRYGWTGGGRILMTDFYRDNMGSFLNGHYSFGPRADRSLLQDFFEQNRGVGLTGETRLDDFLATNYEANEDVYSWYGMGTWTHGRLLAIVGLRHEFTRLDYSGNVLEYAVGGDLAGTTAVAEQSNYNTLFPNFQLRYRLTPLTNLRFAATRSIARPNFSDLVPYQLVNNDRRILSRGNPTLSPTRSYNLDLMGEHYFQAIGVVSAGVFYKRLSDIIFPFGSTVVGGDLDGWFLEQPINGGNAEIYGAEVNWQQQFGFLPGALGGLGIYGNYTYTTSKTDLSGREWSSLPGQAGNSGNAALTYDMFGLNARLSMNYSGEFLALVRDSPAYDRWQDSYRQLDLAASYRLPRGMSVFMEANNLTNAADRMYIGDPSRVRYVGYYGRWTRIGVRYN
jgi:TonB-dependent receptor